MPSFRSRIRRSFGGVAGAALLAAAGLSASPSEKSVTISPELKATLTSGDEIFLTVRPLPGESLDAFVRRVTDDPGAKKAIRAANGGLTRWKPGRAVRVPYR